MDNIVDIQNISKRFGGKQILSSVNLSFPRKHISSIIGKSGVGKSVLLKSVAGLMKPDEGRILYNGQDLLSLSAKEAAKIRRSMGYLFQHDALFNFLNVEDNVAFSLRETGKEMSNKNIKEKVKETLRWVGLDGTQNVFPSELSGGMRKRIAVARTLISEPSLLLFDEPTTGLDPELSDTVVKLISRVNRELNISCIMITHDVYAALSISQYIAYLRDGNIQCHGTPEEIVKEKNPHLQTMLSHTHIPENVQTKKERPPS